MMADFTWESPNTGREWAFTIAVDGERDLRAVWFESGRPMSFPCLRRMDRVPSFNAALDRALSGEFYP